MWQFTSMSLCSNRKSTNCDEKKRLVNKWSEWKTVEAAAENTIFGVSVAHAAVGVHTEEMSDKSTATGPHKSAYIRVYQFNEEEDVCTHRQRWPFDGIAQSENINSICVFWCVCRLTYLDSMCFVGNREKKHQTHNIYLVKHFSFNRSCAHFPFLYSFGAPMPLHLHTLLHAMPARRNQQLRSTTSICTKARETRFRAELMPPHNELVISLFCEEIPRILSCYHHSCMVKAKCNTCCGVKVTPRTRLQIPSADVPDWTQMTHKS